MDLHGSATAATHAATAASEIAATTPSSVSALIGATRIPEHLSLTREALTSAPARPLTSRTANMLAWAAAFFTSSMVCLALVPVYGDPGTVSDLLAYTGIALCVLAGAAIYIGVAAAEPAAPTSWEFDRDASPAVAAFELADLQARAGSVHPQTGLILAAAYETWLKVVWVDSHLRRRLGELQDAADKLAAASRHTSGGGSLDVTSAAFRDQAAVLAAGRADLAGHASTLRAALERVAVWVSAAEAVGRVAASGTRAALEDTDLLDAARAAALNVTAAVSALEL